MSLLVIAICLIAERFLLEYQHLREFLWLARYNQWLERQTLAGWLCRGIPGLLFLLLPPVLLTGLLQDLLATGLFGLPGLLFAGLILLYTLGPRDLDRQIERYAQAAELDQEAHLQEIAGEIMRDTPPPREPARSKGVAECALQQANQRLFAVLFWFVLLGPMGAMLYRIASLLPDLERGQQDPDFHFNAKQLMFILDWVPARLVALCYAVAGSFEDALYGWRSCAEERSHEFGESNSATLICTGSGAIRLTTLLDETEEGLRDYSHLPRAAMALVWRSLVVWLLVLAFLSIAGLV